MIDDKTKILEQVRLYIEGRLSKKEAHDMELRLNDSKELFHSYLEIKESLFLKNNGEKASKKTEKRILSLVKEQKIPHFKIILRLIKNEVIVISGGQDSLDFQGLKANFSYRTDNEAGSTIISRQINGRNLTIMVSPIENTKNFNLSVNFEKKEKIEAVLMIDNKEAEVIPNITKQKMFNTNIHSLSKIDLIFRKDKSVLFTVNLELQSEK